MTQALSSLLGPIAGIMLGLGLVLVVFLLGRGEPTQQPGLRARRLGWFIVVLLGAAVLVINILRLVAMV